MSPKTVWIGTSWKMNKTLAEARDYVDAVRSVPLPPTVQPFLLPPHTALAAVRERLPAGSPIMLGAQNAHWADAGPWTGEISMAMAADAGATLVELGHSERREHFGETDETVAAKTAAALAHDLVPLICVGEPRAVRDGGGAADFIAGQVDAAFSAVGSEEIGRCLIAYEPIWAIGESGRPATSAEVAPIMQTIVQTVHRLSHGGALRALLYGGSVHTDNATDLLADAHTDGLFVGRSAWTPEGFLALVDLAGQAAS